MQDIDATLKFLLRAAAPAARIALCDADAVQWLDTELPSVRSPRADLVGKTPKGELIHIELQSANDPGMPLRMAEYSLAVARIHGQFPRQILLYVGFPPLRPAAQLLIPRLRYRPLDIRRLDGECLLASPDLGDNLVAILARLRQHKAAVGAVVAKIAAGPIAERGPALQKLLLLAGLRHLEQTVRQEVRRMPLLDEILQNKVLGREYKRGLKEGMVQGEARGAARAEANTRAVLLLAIKARFGPRPVCARKRLEIQAAPELLARAKRLRDAERLDDLLPRPARSR